MTDRAELRFFYATMGAGKTTLALQLRHQHEARGFRVVLLTCGDRSGSMVSSRTGLSAPAFCVGPDVPLVGLVADLNDTAPVSRVIIDEAQFLTPSQVDDVVCLVDDHLVPVDCFGLLTDFKVELFPGSKRLLEVADRRTETLLESVCWCGRVASHNARVVAGVIARAGQQVLIGDTAPGEVRYEVLCREHHRAGNLGTRPV